MNAALKALIAAACVCVIVMSGHYGYTVYVQHKAEQARVDQVRAVALWKADEAARQDAVERQNRKERRDAKRKAFLERVAAKRAARAEEERNKQAARDNAAALLKDAVVD